MSITGHSDGLPKTAIGLNIYKNFNFSLIRRRSSEITASTSDRDGCTKFHRPMSHWLCYNVKTCQSLPIASIYLTWPLPVSIEGVVTSCSEAACSEGRPLQATLRNILWNPASACNMYSCLTCRVSKFALVSGWGQALSRRVGPGTITVGPGCNNKYVPLGRSTVCNVKAGILGC